MNKVAPYLIATGAGFLPTQLSGCQMWITADRLGLTDGTAVQTWTDQSGLGNNCSQNTVANRPVFHTNIINGLPAVLFDGTQTYMNLGYAGTQTAPPQSVFVVVQPTANTSAQNNYATIIENDQSTGFFIVAKISTNFWGTFTNADLSSTNALSSGSNYLLETTVASNSTFLYQRGTQVATSGVTESGGNGANTGLGNDPNHAGRFYKGYIAEAIIYNVVLSSANRVKVENYLIGKYSL